MRAMVDLGIDGLNVTMPHKEDAAAGCDELTADAAALRSVNTVVRRDDGTVLGASTDGEGFLRTLQFDLDKPRGYSVLGAEEAPAFLAPRPVTFIWGVGKATKPMLPLIAIPTTAGTGSECQSAALIADAVTHQKMACLDPKAAARIALLDPELTLSLPQAITAASGVDALAHALESAVTRKRNPVSDLFSQDAFVRCLPALAAVLSEPADLGARGQMLLGAAHAGVAIENSMLGAAHSAANRAQRAGKGGCRPSRRARAYRRPPSSAAAQAKALRRPPSSSATSRLAAPLPAA